MRAVGSKLSGSVSIGTIFIVALGLFVAVLLEQELPGSKFFRGVFFVPTVLSLVVVGVVFSFLLDPTFGVLKPALDSLPYIQQNRRIFFLGSWLGAFLGGQTSEAAASVVRDWLVAHPALPLDLKQKVLQNADELDRTVRIRRSGSMP